MTINLKCVGNNGRWGNQLFQYAFSRAYCEKYNTELRTAPWLGQQIFEDMNDPQCVAGTTRCPDEIFPNTPNFGHYEVFGYFQSPQHLSLYDSDFARKIFSFKQEILDKLTVPEGDYIAVHKRRGDYVTTYSNVFCIVSDKSYQDCIDKINTDNLPIMECSEENRSVNENLPQEMQFLQDFYILMNAKILLRSNSTFSWWAHVLGREDQEIYSPVVNNLTGWNDVEFVNSNSPGILWRSPWHQDMPLGGRK